MSSTPQMTAASTTDNNAGRRRSSLRDGKGSSRVRSSRTESVRPIVRRDALRGVINSGLRQQRFIGRVIHYVPGLSHRRINVEANKNCTSSSIFYVPQKKGITPCQIKKVRPSAEHVVRSNDEFFVSFVGMSIASHDNETGFSAHRSDNELLLYSTKCLTRTQGLGLVPKKVEEELARDNALAQNQLSSPSTPNEDDGGEIPPNERGGETIDVVQQTAQNARVDTGYASMFTSEDRVYIHYDPVVDARNSGTMADTFVTIPATKRIYACSEELSLSTKDVDDHHHGDEGNQQSQCVQSLFMRFTVMEIDKISDLQARAVIGVDHFGSFVSQSAGSIPYIQLLTKAFAVASSAGRHGLKSYSRPDHVLTVDKEFFLANPVRDSDVESNEDESKQENYLRYGYYFFLNKPVEAKLYAKTNTADENVPLMMKRTDMKQRPGRRECEYIPLTETSYVVMKVTRGCCKLSHEDIARRSEGHKLRLDNMLSMSTAIEVLAEAERKKGGLLPRL